MVYPSYDQSLASECTIQRSRAKLPKDEKVGVSTHTCSKKASVRENSGRVSRWAIDLGEHEIEFKPRNKVKEQILADFLAETQEGEDDKEKEPSEKEKGSIRKSVTRSFTHMERQSKMAPEGTNTC
ncbi:hypothetical protein Tco_0919269 [Tanacetum coccineum]